MLCISKICKSLLVVCILLLIFIPGIAEASLSWECTHWRGSYGSAWGLRGQSGQVGSAPSVGGNAGGTAYCSSATISGSISASISSSDRQDIANRVSNLSIIQGISSNASSAASRASTAISRATQARDYAQQARDAVNNLSIPTVNEIQSGLATGSEVSSSRDTIRQDISSAETSIKEDQSGLATGSEVDSARDTIRQDMSSTESKIVSELEENQSLSGDISQQLEEKDSTPPTLEIWWENDKNSTTSNQETLNISATDNETNQADLQYRYLVNDNDFTSWSAYSQNVKVPLEPGHNVVVFEVRDEAGNISSKRSSIWRLE